MPTEPMRYARKLVETAETRLPEEWTTEQMGDFWEALIECSLPRLARLKPELVRHICLDSEGRPHEH